MTISKNHKFRSYDVYTLEDLWKQLQNVWKQFENSFSPETREMLRELYENGSPYIYGFLADILRAIATIVIIVLIAIMIYGTLLLMILAFEKISELLKKSGNQP